LIASQSSIDYEDKVAPLEWAFSSDSDRASTKLFPTNVKGVEPEDYGVWGESRIYMDDNGVNWLELSLNAGWDTKWESSSAGNTFYGGIYWHIQNMENITVKDGEITVAPGTEFEVAIQGAVRD